jgi:DNA-binding NarL/FixJ family response regulator
VPAFGVGGDLTVAPRVRVIIADDELPARHGLKALLSLCAEVEVVGEASDGEEALRLVDARHPDVVLMDARMPRMSGLEAAHAIKSRWPEVRVVIVSMYPASRTEPFADESDAFLLKGFGPEQLRDAVFGVGNRHASAPTEGGRGLSH